ncbi:RDD family protein [Chitinimonas sp.]|uniref:RDD family protein n=1 Tax=Chitinimonas sp. TaxID=1934313 RepID=UPI0035AF9C71
MWSQRAVTPEALNVSNELLGVMLAPPKRRLLAIGVDLLVVAVLSGMHGIWMIIGAMVLVWRLALRWGAQSISRRRLLFAGIGVAFLLYGGMQQLLSQMEHTKVGQLLVFEEEDEKPGTASAAVLSDAERIAQLEHELALARQPHAFAWTEQLKRLLQKLSNGFGAAILYFTFVPAMWRGQTLGKRLFGLRVVELTGKPLSVINCFSRYGGYAAGMATGLFGFAQVLWDPNRQAIQDKIAHTVVIDERAPRMQVGPASG